MKLKVKREVFYNHKKCAIEFNIEGPGRIGYCDNSENKKCAVAVFDIYMAAVIGGFQKGLAEGDLCCIETEKESVTGKYLMASCIDGNPIIELNDF